ncbi:hypothetical protein [Kitasatospora cineracea]|uniref:Uncharacterized protein n=1 Tax=Kitasatospora cineracea TaxID=88074 RepID=A0A3N4RY22_9ACTN|nr:hypothetical protein [Kitasatospora cineracea]RPE35971.1 hypothetical protein EDD38_4338 [Kitasatospora cineracea]
MGEVPGAHEESERAGDVRRVRLAGPVEQPTPGTGPGLPPSGGPEAVDRGEPAEFRGPEPVRTPGAVTPGFVLCYECDGLGACDQCGGRGWFPDAPPGRRRCPACFGRRVCPICRGGGELAVSDLSAYQRGYHPEL